MPAPSASMSAAMAMPGQQPPGLAAQAGVAPSPLGQPQAAPLPPMGSGAMPPLVGSLPGQQPLMPSPAQQVQPSY